MENNTTQLKKFTPETMKEIVYVTWPTLAPAGDKAAWVDWKGDMKSGLFSSKIHLMENLLQNATGAEGMDAARKESVLTPDGVKEKQPVFLSDGVHMAYLSNETGEFQVFIKNLNTNEKRQITTLRHGVLRYKLSDDETKLVFEATLWPEEIQENTAFEEMTPEKKAQWEEDLDWRPYEITNLTYKLDEWHGMRKGEFSHIGTAELSSKKQKLFTSDCMEKMEAIYPSWSHDGKKIAFYGYPYEGAKGFDVELFVCDENGKNLKQISRDNGIYGDHAPAFTADDTGIVTMVFGDFEDGSCVQLPMLFDLINNTHRYLIDEWDESICHGVHPLRAGSLEYGDHSPYFKLTKDGKYLYFQTGRHGRYSLCRVRIDAAKSETAEVSSVTGSVIKPSSVEMVLEGQTDIQEFSMNENGQIVTVQADWLHPAELWMNGEKLTDSNPWLSEYAIADVEEYWVKSKDGKADLQYFLVKPVSFEKNKQYPAVLDIKGGPTTMYGLTFWHEFQALASLGMAVIFGNPRGSTGFGRAYCAGGVYWGNEAMDDLVQFVEDAISKGFIDEKRVGVTGGSYGGYMTNKLIGRTKVFAAAVTQRCLANTATSYGTGDMGFVSSRPIPKHFHMLDYLEDRARGNIISYVDHFKVPLLILHAYQDYRCGFEQAEQVFIPMKERNPEIPCRMVMFPNENHGMTRNGKLYHQVRHLQEMTDWFAKYLIEEPDWKTKADEKSEKDTDFMKTQEVKG